MKFFILAFLINYFVGGGTYFHENEGVEPYYNLQPDDIDSGEYDQYFLDEENNDEDNEITNPKKFSQPDISGQLCARECDGVPRTCYYKFKIEHYSAMGYACGNCTCTTLACTNFTDCYNEHCITADGVHRNMITVNRRYPGPSIYVCKGDRVVVDVTNLLQGKATTLHWHGIFQKGMPWMDGVAMVSQCPILPGNTFRYSFNANEPGTHFWHEHAGLIKLDGVQGPLIVREPKNEAPPSFNYNYDLPSHILFLNDWKHFMADDEFPDMKAFDGGKRIQSLLINGKGRFDAFRLPYYFNNPSARSPLKTFHVTQGRSYRFRVIGAFCMMCAIELLIENHDLTIIAVDGNPIIPVTVSSVVITSGERFDIVINALQPINSYWIHLRGINPCHTTTQVALLNYNNITRRRNFENPPSLLRTLNHPNMNLENPVNQKISELRSSLPTPQFINNPNSTSRFTFVVSSVRYTVDDFIGGASTAPLFFKPFATGAPFRSTINGISSLMSTVPLFSQFKEVSQNQFCSEECVSGTSPEPCQPCVHLVKIPLNRTVDFIISDPSNYTGIVHPFHLHGHKFYVLDQGMMNVTVQSLIEKLNNNQISIHHPPMKDTIIVPQGTYAIIRFFTDNPGVWIFHCHYIYHNAVGMHVFLQIGEETDFPKVPTNFPTCGDYLPPI